MRAKIKDTNKLQNKIAKIPGYKNNLHASKVTKVKGKNSRSIYKKRKTMSYTT